MTTLSGLVNIAGAGLQAQTAGLDATGQNVANANTAGYSRVTANLETTPTDGYSGSVQVTGITRSYDQFTFGTLLTEQGKSGAADARSNALTQTETTMAPSDGTISDAMSTFFSAVSTLEASPADTSARAGVLQAATNVAQNVSTTASALAAQRTSLYTQAQTTAQTLNTNLSQIAKLNGQIAKDTASGNEPTDLEDQRDQLVSQVSTAIGAQVISGSNGITLLSAGTALVTGTSAASLAVSVDSSNNLKITSTRTDGAAVDITTNVISGTLGGIREARDTDISSAQSQLDTLASNFTTAVNAVQSAGYGTDGVTGRNLFTPNATVSGSAAAMAVDPSVAGNPAAIGAASTAAGLPGGDDNLVSLGALSSTALATGQNPSDTFATIAANVGNASAAAKSESTLRTDTVTQASNLNSSTSGVSIDEEMTNMSQFQRAYEASSKVLQTADSLLAGLMQELA